MVRYYIIIILLTFSITLFGQKDSIGQEELITIIGTSPVYNGDILEFIQAQINYSEIIFSDSIKNSIVWVRFWIETSGITTEHQIVRGVRKDLDEEAIRVAQLIKFDEPAMQKDKLIRVVYRVPVTFFPSCGLKKEEEFFKQEF